MNKNIETDKQLPKSVNRLGAPEFEERSYSGRIYQLPAAKIAPNPSQPRKRFDDDAIIRLADSIRRYGILQPLSVRRLAEGEKAEAAVQADMPADSASGAEDEFEYQLIAGERRLRAAKLIGLSEVPCIIMEADGRRSAELAIIENIQRENLNIFEQAGAIAALIDIYDLTQEQVARQLSTSQSYVANKLRILRLTSAERAIILDGNLTERHARALLKIDDAELRIKALTHIAARALNVASAEAYIERVVAEDRAERAKNRRKIIIKDIRLFYNSIDHAVDLVRQAGIEIIADRREIGEGVEVVIRIPRLCAPEQQKPEPAMAIHPAVRGAV